MKKLITFLFTSIFLLSLVPLASADLTQFHQYTSTADKWYAKHKVGYNPYPADKLVIYFNEHDFYSDNKFSKFYRPVNSKYDPYFNQFKDYQYSSYSSPTGMRISFGY